MSVGLSEAITYAFTSARSLEILGAPKPTVLLKNPLGEHHAVMRTTLLPGLLDAVANARRHGEREVREFTIGPVFLAAKKDGDGLPDEQLRIGVVLAGDRPGWLEKPQPLDAWDAKGYAVAIAQRLGGPPAVVEVVPASREEAASLTPHLHPRGAAFLTLGAASRRIGSFGPLHPDAVEALGLDGDVLVAEIDLEPFVDRPHAAAVRRHPALPGEHARHRARGEGRDPAPARWRAPSAPPQVRWPRAFDCSTASSAARSPRASRASRSTSSIAQRIAR